jgi:phage tail protein X
MHGLPDIDDGLPQETKDILDDFAWRVWGQPKTSARRSVMHGYPEDNNDNLSQEARDIIDDFAWEVWGKKKHGTSSTQTTQIKENKSMKSHIHSVYSSIDELAQAFVSGEIYLQRDVENALEGMGGDPRQAFNLMKQWKDSSLI